MLPRLFLNYLNVCYIQKEMINQLEQKVINVEQQNNEVLMVAKAKREHQRTPESTFAAC